MSAAPEQPPAPAAPPRHWEADVLLRDGSTAHIRPIVPEDAELLKRKLYPLLLAALLCALVSLHGRVLWYDLEPEAWRTYEGLAAAAFGAVVPGRGAQGAGAAVRRWRQ